MEKFQLPSEFDNTEMEKFVELFPQFFREGYFDFDEFKSYISGIVPDDLQQKYSFTWHGKAECYRLLKKTSHGTLRPCKEDSVDWDTTQNLYIEGDNLEVLKLIKHTYAGKDGVKMIYIDPPYNSNEDFIYDDHFMDSLDKYLEYTGQKGIAIPEVAGRYHTKWLNMMYPRLWLANYLLRDDGAIFISIDDREHANLKKLCDEVFGDENFIGIFPRVTKKGGKSSDATAKNHDYIIAYAKSIANVDLVGVSHMDSGYNKKDEHFETRGYYKLNQTLDYDSLSYSKSLDYPIEIDGQIFYPGGDIEKYNNRQAGEHSRADWAWRWSKDLFKFGYDNGFIVVNNGGSRPRIYTKTYQNVKIVDNNEKYEIVKIDRTKPLSTLEFAENKYSNDNAKKALDEIMGFTAFEYTKPPELIIQLAKLIGGKDYTILDFFSGSASTAQAIMQLNAEDGGNRNFIMVQLPESIDPTKNRATYDFLNKSSKPINICEIGKERIRRAGAKIKAENELTAPDLDVGFRVFKLDKSNFRVWDDTPIDIKKPEEVEQFYEQLKTHAESPFIYGRSHEDIIYELIRLNNYPLTTPLIPIGLDNGTVYGVGEDCDFIICLDVEIDDSAAEELCKYRPGRILFTDSCFADTEARTNVEHTIRGINDKIKLGWV